MSIAGWSTTGWTGGIYGVGRRMPIKVTRTLLTAALDGSLKNAEFRTDPYFGFAVPTSVPGVEPHLLYPFKTWQNKAEFDETARKLVACSRRTSPSTNSTSRGCSRRRAGSAHRGGIVANKRMINRRPSRAAFFIARS